VTVSTTRWRVETANAAACLRDIGDELDALLASHGISIPTRYAARLVCEEIVLNALEHGAAQGHVVAVLEIFNELQSLLDKTKAASPRTRRSRFTRTNEATTSRR